MSYPMRRHPLAAAFALSLMVSALSPEHHLAALEQAPFWGTWNQNLTKSSERSESPYKRVISRIEPWEDGLRVTYDMVGKRGGVTHLEWTGKFDGRDYPMQGVDNVLTNAYRRIDDRTYEIVIKVEGNLRATARVVVSPDGNTLQVATETRTASGQTVTTTAIYERQ